MDNYDNDRIERDAPLWRWTDFENERRFELDRGVFRTAATIVVERDGNPLRSIITGGKRIYTGVFQSLKTRRSAPWESRKVELPAMWEAEVRTDVKWWLAQPLRFEFQDRDRKLIYLPDQARRVLEGAAWRTVIVECKRRAEEVSKDPDYARKIEIFAEVCRRVRWSFEIVDEDGLGARTYRRNVAAICLDRRTLVGARDTDALRRIASDGVVAYGPACEALGGFVVGKKKLHALMVKRVVAIPLDRVITCATTVSLVDRSDEPIGGDALFD